jgi:hypothetical protein
VSAAASVALFALSRLSPSAASATALALAREDRFHDRHAACSGDVGYHVVDLEIHLIERLVHVLHVPDTLAHKAVPVPPQAADRSHIRGRAERRAQQPHRVQVLQPLAVLHVGFPSRHVFDVSRVDQIERMQQVKGVGPVLAATVCALMPEIGTLGDKTISALAGVAPHPNQSGPNDRPRHVRGGRKHVRDVLYMAALCAITHNPILRRFYKRLKDKGKHGYVCIVAVMRKLICLLNQICANPNFIIA